MHYTKSTVHAAEMKAGLETDSGDTVNEMFMTVRKVSTAQKHRLRILPLQPSLSSVKGLGMLSVCGMRRADAWGSSVRTLLRAFLGRLKYSEWLKVCSYTLF